MNKSKEVWKRTGPSNLTLRTYAFFIGVFFLASLLLLVMGVRIGYDWGPNFFVSLVAFIVSIIGINIFSKSEEPVQSFAGVALLSFSMGVAIGPIIAYYNAITVIQALTLTLGVTVLMSILGIVMPGVMKKMAGLLFVGLLLLLVGYLAQWFFFLFRIPAQLTFLDYFAAGLFSLYIWYDWSRALSLPRTIDNAIDTSGALLLDFVNLFLALLRILGRNS